MRNYSRIFFNTKSRRSGQPFAPPLPGFAVIEDEFLELAEAAVLSTEAGEGGARDFGVGGDLFYAQKFISVDKSD